MAARLEKGLPFRRANMRRSPNVNSEVHEKVDRHERVAELLTCERWQWKYHIRLRKVSLRRPGSGA